MNRMNLSAAQRAHDAQMPEPEDCPRWHAEWFEEGWCAVETETEIMVRCHSERRARMVAHELNAGGAPSELDAALMAIPHSPALPGPPDGKPMEQGLGHGNAVGRGVPVRSVTAQASCPELFPAEEIMSIKHPRYRVQPSAFPIGASKYLAGESFDIIDNSNARIVVQLNSRQAAESGCEALNRGLAETVYPDGRWTLDDDQEPS